MRLFISPEMYRKVPVIVECPIDAFIYCNSRNDHIVRLLNELSLSLDEYNGFFMSGSAFDKKGRGVLMPFMEIRSGVSVDHDGGHRAVALRNAGNTHVPVALLGVRDMGELPDVIRGAYRGEIKTSDLLPHDRP